MRSGGRAITASPLYDINPRDITMVYLPDPGYITILVLLLSVIVYLCLPLIAVVTFMLFAI